MLCWVKKYGKGLDWVNDEKEVGEGIIFSGKRSRYPCLVCMEFSKLL